jgi:WD40 repeat protein
MAGKRAAWIGLVVAVIAIAGVIAFVARSDRATLPSADQVIPPTVVPATTTAPIEQQPTVDGIAVIPRTAPTESTAITGDAATHVAFSPGGRLLVARAGGRIDFVDLVTGQRQPVGLKLAGPRAVALSPDGGRIAVAAAGGTEIWHVLSASRTRLEAGDVRALAFAPGGLTLATADASGVIKLWDTTSWATTATLPGGRGVNAITFSPGRARLAVAGDGAAIWNLAERKIEKRLLATSCAAIDFAPDERTLATASNQGVTTWESVFWQTRAVLGGPATHVAFWRGGSVVVVAGSDGMIRIWDLATGGLLTTLTGMNGPITSMSLSSDSRNIAACGGAGVILWDAATRTSRKL